MNSPSFSSFHEHLSSLYQNRGTEKTKNIIKLEKINGIIFLRPEL